MSPRFAPGAIVVERRGAHRMAMVVSRGVVPDAPRGKVVMRLVFTNPYERRDIPEGLFWRSFRVARTPLRIRWGMR